MICVEVHSNNVLTVRNDTLANAVSDSVKHETVKFLFGDNWKDYQKTAVFSADGVEPINILLNSENELCLSQDECYIPFEVLKGDSFTLSVFGVSGDSIATTTKVEIAVFTSGYALGDIPGEPTQSEYSQIIDIMTATKEIAESVRDDADNGLFKGEKGDRGEQGIQGPQGEKGEKGDVYTLTEVDKKAIAKEVTSSLYSIPDYWKTHLEERVEDIRTAMETAGRNKSAFFFYSDAHWSNDDTYTSKLSPTILKYLYKKTPINQTNYGGDIVSDESTDTDIMAYLWDWRERLRGLPNHHSVIGNHDDGNSTDRLLSKEYIYSYLLAPEESNDIVCGGDFYYYIDNKSENTRYLYLDTFYDGVSTAQQNFVKEALISTPVNWHIVAISHAWFKNDYSLYPPVLNGFDTTAKILLDMFDSYNARSEEYIDCGGCVELCIGGHYHLDHYAYTDGGIPVILVEADTLHDRSGAMPQKETTDEAAVSAVVVDYKTQVVKVIRVGRGESYEVPINTNTATYTNVIPLSIATDGTIFNNGKGWADNSRIGSGGIYLGNGTHYVTGHIEINPNIDNVIRLRNMTFDSSTHNNYAYSLTFFDADFAKAKYDETNNSILSTDFVTVGYLNGKTDGSNVIEFTIPAARITNKDVKYFAICCSYISDDSIITINESID